MASCCASCASGGPCSGVGVGAGDVIHPNEWGFDADGDGIAGAPAPLGGRSVSGAWGLAGPLGRRRNGGRSGGGRNGAPAWTRAPREPEPRRQPRPRRRPARRDVADGMASMAGTVVPVALGVAAGAGVGRLMGWW